jgi:hypothetical protein
MAEYSKPNFYTAYSYEDGQWWVGFNMGDPYWTGPFEILLAKLEEIQRRFLKSGIWKKGVLRRYRDEWKLTLI